MNAQEIQTIIEDNTLPTNVGSDLLDDVVDDVDMQAELTQHLGMLIKSVKNNIDSQSLMLKELELVEPKTDKIIASIRETKKIIKINSEFLKQADIIDARKFDLSPMVDFFIQKPKYVEKLKKYPQQYTVALNEMVNTLHKNKQVTFHHPDHIKKVFNAIGISDNDYIKLIGLFSTYINNISFRTNSMYLRYILTYFGNMLKLLTQVEVITCYSADGWPAHIDTDKQEELNQTCKNASEYIATQTVIIKQKLTDIFTKLEM